MIFTKEESGKIKRLKQMLAQVENFMNDVEMNVVHKRNHIALVADECVALAKKLREKNDEKK